MTVKNALQRWRFAAVPVLLICAGITAIGFWQGTTFQKAQSSDEAKKSAFEGVRKGLGNEVYFPPDGASEKQVLSAVESVDSFVHARSNMKMSKETKERLVRMETDSLSGAAPRIRTEDLSAALADTLVERFSGLTDKEIDYAAKTTQQNGDLLVLRKNGDHSTSSEGFVAAARALRDQSREGATATREALLTAIDEQLTQRLDLFQQATPEKFSQGKGEGITPLQAIVIAYSIAADDELMGSREELNRAALFGQNPTRAKAFGVNGRIFSTPLHLLFNTKTMTGLLDRLEKGGQ